MKLQPTNVDEVWPEVRGRASPWLTDSVGGEEELLREIREKRAFCWSSAQVVVVLSLSPMPDGSRDLFVRAVVGRGPSQDVVDTHLADVDKIARELGAKRIRFRSTRAGWLRSLDSRWTISHVEYVTEVSEP
jgi:hypothetical protein